MKLYGTVDGAEFMVNTNPVMAAGPELADGDAVKLEGAALMAAAMPPNRSLLNRYAFAFQRSFGEREVRITGVDYGDGEGIEAPEFGEDKPDGKIH